MKKHQHLSLTERAAALRERTVRSLARALERASDDWIAAAPPSARPEVEAFCSRMAPEALALLRGLDLPTWERIERMRDILDASNLSALAASSAPFLPEQVRTFLRSGQ